MATTDTETQYPDERTVDNAARYLNAKIRGWRTGAEAREIARTSRDADLRDAARILDLNDARMVAERARGQR